MSLRHLTHSKHEISTPSVEELQALIGRLTSQRQQLRAMAACHEELEQNRREIAAAQWELSYALIARYLPTAA